MRCLALKAKSPEIDLTMSWQSSNTPRTAMLKMLASCSEYICAAWTAAMRREHEDLHVLLAAQGVLGGRPRVAGRRADRVEPPAVLLQRVLEQVPEELHRDILEGERGPVGEAEEKEALLELFDGRDVLA